MNIFKKIEKFGSKMTTLDFAIFKLAMVMFTLFLMTAFPGFRKLVLQVSWCWYLGLTVVFAVPLLIKIFKD